MDWAAFLESHGMQRHTEDIGKRVEEVVGVFTEEKGKDFFNALSEFNPVIGGMGRKSMMIMASAYGDPSAAWDNFIGPGVNLMTTGE